MRKFAFISKGNVAVVLGLFLIASAAGLEFSYRNSPVIITHVETSANLTTIEHTSQLSSTGSLAISTGTELTRSARYSSVTGTRYPTCPRGGTYFASICTSLCGCQYDVCVSFDGNCSNDYPAVYVANIQVYTSYVRITATSTLFSTFTTQSTYCTTLQSERTAITTRTETHLPSGSSPTATVLGVLGIAALSGYALLRLRNRAMWQRIQT